MRPQTTLLLVIAVLPATKLRLGDRMKKGFLFLLVMVVGLFQATAAVASPRGAVYVASNSPSGNSVLVFWRAADGSLTSAGAFPTGGRGTGTGLGNQGGLILSPDDDWLFVVNAGSNEVTVFEVRPDGLRRTDKVNSGGNNPLA